MNNDSLKFFYYHYRILRSLYFSESDERFLTSLSVLMDNYENELSKVVFGVNVLDDTDLTWTIIEVATWNGNILYRCERAGFLWDATYDEIRIV